MASIKRSELNRLIQLAGTADDERRKATFLTSINLTHSKEIRTLNQEADVLAKRLVIEKTNSLALQEKLTISVENEARLRKEIERLQKTGTTLASYILVQYTNTPEFRQAAEPEQITPPPCLKPLDAMKWNEQVVSGSITYRG